MIHYTIIYKIRDAFMWRNSSGRSSNKTLHVLWVCTAPWYGMERPPRDVTRYCRYGTERPPRDVTREGGALQQRFITWTDIVAGVLSSTLDGFDGWQTDGRFGWPRRETTSTTAMMIMMIMMKTTVSRGRVGGGRRVGAQTSGQPLRRPTPNYKVYYWCEC